MKQKTKKAAHSTTDRTAKAPKGGAKTNNSNSELKNQVFNALDLFIEYEHTPKGILKVIGLLNKNNDVITNYAVISRNTAAFVKELLKRTWGHCKKDLQRSKATSDTAAKVEETKEPPYKQIMGYVYGILQNYFNNKITAEESVMLIKSFLTKHGA